MNRTLPKLLCLLVLASPGIALADGAETSTRPDAAGTPAQKSPARDIEPAGDEVGRKAKERTGRSRDAEPQKRKRYKRCKLGDFDCYDATSQRLA